MTRRSSYGTASRSGLTEGLSGLLSHRPDALMMTRRRGPGFRERGNSMRAATGSARAGVASAADLASDYASGIRDRFSEQVDELRESAGDYAGRATRYAQETGQAITDRSQEVMDRARSGLRSTIDDVLREQPLMLGALGLAAGATLAVLLPPTEVENRTLGGSRDQLAKAAGRVAHDRFEQLKAAAGEAGEKVKDALTSGTLDADTIKSVATDMADSLKGAGDGTPRRKAE